ncbi:MAG: helix-turn-helix domain-containing protein [Phycisphaerales bacterium]
MGTSSLHNPAYRRLCDELKSLRLGKALTVRALGERLKKHHSYIWKVENAERRIDPLEFAEWCKACDTDPCKVLRKVLR